MYTLTLFGEREFGVIPLDFVKIFSERKLESLSYRATLFACSYV